MAALLVVALLALASAPTYATSPMPQYSMPLAIDLMQEFVTDIIPCLTPCLLDNADKVLREIELGPNSQGIYKCGRWMSEKVSQVHDMQGAYRLFESFRNSQELCRHGQESITCFRGEVEKMCGIGVATKVALFMKKTMAYLDCNPHNPRPIRLAECVAEPILSGIQDSVKTETIATCTQPHFDYLGRWEYIYSTQNQTNFPEVSRAVLGVKDCVKTFMMPKLGSLRCQNTEAEMERQVKGMLDFAKNQGVMSCLGDPKLYQDNELTLGRCASRFGEKFARVMQEVGRYGTSSANVKFLLKSVADRACGDINTLMQCMRSVLESRERMACRRAVLPLLRNATEPAVDYFNCLGNCSTSCKKNTGCSCLKDYRVMTELIGTCPHPPTSPPSTHHQGPAIVDSAPTPRKHVLLTIYFLIENMEYDPRLITRLEEDIKPVIERILQNRFSDVFFATLGYRAHPGQGYVEVSFQAIFTESMTDNPEVVESAIERTLYNGILYGRSRDAYKVKHGSVRAHRGPASKPAHWKKSRFSALMVIYPVAGLLGLILIVIVVAYCCCRPTRNERANTNNISGVANPGYISSAGVPPGVHSGDEVKVPL